MRFSLDSALASILRPGVLWFEEAIVIEHDHRMDAPLAGRGGRGANQSAHRNDGRPHDVQARRHRSHQDAPSSEALLRRVRKGDTLPRINSMVDVCNWCSFEFQLPYGLYDAARIEGDVTLRIGREGRVVPGIRKDDVHVGGRIALVDAAGPFGNPTSDSARTMVTTATTRGLLVVFAPRDVDAARLVHVMDVTIRTDAGVHRMPRSGPSGSVESPGRVFDPTQGLERLRV
jgi:hypothetical protein